MILKNWLTKNFICLIGEGNNLTFPRHCLYILYQPYWIIFPMFVPLCFSLSLSVCLSGQSLFVFYSLVKSFYVCLSFSLVKSFYVVYLLVSRSLSMSVCLVVSASFSLSFFLSVALCLFVSLSSNLVCLLAGVCHFVFLPLSLFLGTHLAGLATGNHWAGNSQGRTQGPYRVGGGSNLNPFYTLCTE